MKYTIGLMVSFLGFTLFSLVELRQGDDELMRLESQGIQRELANDVLERYILERDVIVSAGVVRHASQPLKEAYLAMEEAP